MSEMETHVGTLKEINLHGLLSIEDWCKQYVFNQGLPLDNCDNYKNCTEYVTYEYSEKIIISKGHIYEIIKDTSYDNDDIYEANYNTDGTINYILSFYNGGCGFSEAIEQALEDIEGE